MTDLEKQLRKLNREIVNLYNDGTLESDQVELLTEITNKALDLNLVSHQRELLIAFMEYVQTKQAIHFIDKNELADEYLKSNL